MTNRNYLENNIKIRDSMLDFLMNQPKINIEKALRLNNEIFLMTIRINKMKSYTWSKLKEQSIYWELEINSKINEL